MQKNMRTSELIRVALLEAAHGDPRLLASMILLVSKKGYPSSRIVKLAERRLDLTHTQTILTLIQIGDAMNKNYLFH